MPLQRVIERVDAQLRPAQVIRVRHRRHHALMHVRQERIVDLHIEPGVDDGLVFLVQRLGEREQIGLLVLIMFDLGARQRACRRDHGQESSERRVLLFGLGDSGFDVLDVASDLIGAGVTERPVDDDAVAEPFAEASCDIVLGIEFRKCLAVPSARHRGHRVFQFFGRGRAHGNALEPLENIECPVQPLAELAVADDVDTGLGLLAHDLGDEFGQAGLEGRLVVGLAVFDGAPELDQLGWPDQAADMGGEDAIGVVRHGGLPFVVFWRNAKPLMRRGKVPAQTVESSWQSRRGALNRSHGRAGPVCRRAFARFSKTTKARHALRGYPGLDFLRASGP